MCWLATVGLFHQPQSGATFGSVGGLKNLSGQARHRSPQEHQTRPRFQRERPPQLVAVLDESLLRRSGEGYDDLMAEQITQLIAQAERPNISVHVIPVDVVLHIGLSGPFILARAADGGWVGHLENQLGGVVVDSDDVAPLLARWETVRNEALSRRQSIELMKEIVKSWT